MRKLPLQHKPSPKQEAISFLACSVLVFVGSYLFYLAL